jgi:hypothetical protein
MIVIHEMTCCHGVTDKLRDVHTAIADVMRANEGLNWSGSKYLRDADVAKLIEAFLRFMTESCALFAELGCYLAYKIMNCIVTPHWCLCNAVPPAPFYA